MARQTDSPEPGSPHASERADPRIWKIAIAVMCGPLMSSLDSTIVNVSLDTLSRELASPLAAIQWVTSAYLLALALVLPLSGWLVDRVGARRLYVGCFLAFTLASALCGSARSAPALIAFRVLQGLAGGLLAPMAQLMMARFGGPNMAKVMSFAVMPVVLGQIVGPTVAGLILQQASWRWIFFINVPIGIVATGLALALLPRDELGPRRRFDLVGFLMVSPGLVFLLDSLDELTRYPDSRGFGFALAAAGVVLITGFWVHARRRRADALIDISLFGRPAFRAAAATQFLSNILNLGGQLLMPLYFLTVLGDTPVAAGLLLAPTGIGVFLGLPMTAWLSDRFGARLISAGGAALTLLGTLPFALAGADPPALVLGAGLFVRGLGLGSINIPSAASAYTSVPREALTSATTALNIAQRLGGPIGTTVIALFLEHLIARSPDRVAAFDATFWLLCAASAMTMLAALGLPATVLGRRRG